MESPRFGIWLSGTRLFGFIGAMLVWSLLWFTVLKASGFRGGVQGSGRHRVLSLGFGSSSFWNPFWPPDGPELCFSNGFTRLCVLPLPIPIPQRQPKGGSKQCKGLSN